MIYFGTRLSENISRREPEGYLICLNVPVARTGAQEYLPEEIGKPPGGLPVAVFRLEQYPPFQRVDQTALPRNAEFRGKIRADAGDDFQLLHTNASRER